MTDGDLSRDRAHLADLQRKRRARMVRIDYMPSADALAIIEAKRGRYYPLNTNSGIIDAILSEWVVLIGIKRDEVSKPKRPEFRQQAQARMTFDAARSARAQRLASWHAHRLDPRDSHRRRLIGSQLCHDLLHLAFAARLR